MPRDADPAVADESPDEEIVRFRRTRALRERMHSRRATKIVWQTGVFVVGWGIVLAGIAMLVLPGPGWAAIFVGLAVLATEYAWAHRLLTRARRWARTLADRALDPRVRRRNQLILATAVLVSAGLGLVYYREWGLTLDGVRALFG